MNGLRDYIARNYPSQAAFARASGISEAMLSLYLAGKRNPGREAAVGMERATKGRFPVEFWSGPRAA